MNSDGNYAYLMGSLLKQKVLPFLPHRDGIPAQRPTTLCNFFRILFGVMSCFTHTSHVLKVCAVPGWWQDHKQS